jgi:nucleoid-associated protein YgaU
MLAGAPDLLRDALNKGEELVPVSGSGGAATETPAAPAGPSSSMAGVKEYTIQPGDSLSKITAKFLGRYTPANAAIILSLNPKLKANPDRIIVGETCQVPASPEAAASLRPTAPARPESAKAAEQKPADKPVKSPAADKTYTVKKGDTLWSIAAKQLGNGVRHKDILKLNADQLDTADDLQPGMKLKLPA